jgi:hypothetical protein
MSVPAMAFTLGAAVIGWQTGLSDTVVPVEPRIAVTVPISGNGEVDALQQMLTSAGVPFGLEHASGDVPPDSRAARRSIAVSGLRLGDALDRIVALDPRYTWRESGGRIVMRAAHRDATSFLDRTIPRVAVNGASLQASLETMMGAAIPTRPAGGVATAVAGTPTRVGGGIPFLSAARLEPAITVSLERTSVADVLDAIAAAHGSVSWVVRYATEDAHPDGVSVSLITPAHTITAISVNQLRSGRRANVKRILIPFGDLRTALTIYRARSKVRIGFERVVSSARAVAVSGVPPLDLTHVVPREAIRRIVEMDSRYEWIEWDGMFEIRPRPDLASVSLLDRRVERITVHNEPIETILDRLLEAGTSGEPPARTPAAAASRPAKPGVRRYSLNLQHTTVRGVLNALCRADGTLSWVTDPVIRSDGMVDVNVSVHSWDGWSVGHIVRAAR